MKTVLVCWECGASQDGKQIRMVDDSYSETEVVSKEFVEGIRQAIRQDVYKRVQGKNGIVVGRPVIRSIVVLEEESRIVRPR